MTPKTTKSTGLGADAFFAVPTSSRSRNKPSAPSMEPPSLLMAPNEANEKSERRSFNLRLSILRQLDEIQIKTMREGNKQTLSSIVERGIELVAKEMGVSDAMNKRVNEPKSK